MKDKNLPCSFDELGLPDTVLKAVHTVGYEKPSPIQAAAIPPLMRGNDLIGQAQTGTGKTAAFALPLLSKIKISQKSPQALILTPTRELAIQVAEALQTYARHLKGFHVLPLYGGQDMRTQLRQLKKGVQVVVGTPGRLLDHLNRKSLNLSRLQMLVLDEADEMLRMGFIDDVEAILSHTSGSRQTALFSATLPGPIRQVAKRFLNNPTQIKIETQTVTVDTIEQRYWMLNHRQKLEALTRVLEFEEMDAAIIFVRTRETTVQLAEKIAARGYSCSAINGDLSQSQREKTIRDLKKGIIDILVATDVAARGLDVERISHVINYDIPYDSEAYVHRIGRTGRAGRTGQALLFVTPREQHLLRTIEKATGQRIKKLTLPTSKEIGNQRVLRFKQRISEAQSTAPKPFFDSLVRELCEDLETSPDSLAATLAYLLQEDRPLNPKPETMSNPGRKTQNRKETETNEKDRGKKQRHKDNSRNMSKSRPEQTDTELETFRVEVGSTNQVTPGDLVGAIANEAGIDSRYFGRIQIHDNYSTVELPVGMPKDIFKHLKSVWVRNRKLAISRADTQQTPSRSKAARKPVAKKRKADRAKR